MRTLSSMEQLVATVDGSGLQVHQYIEGRIEATVRGEPRGHRLHDRLSLGGPGRADHRRDPEHPWTLGLRIPDWCRSSRLSVAGDDPDDRGRRGQGERRTGLAVGDRVVLELEMPVRD